MWHFDLIICFLISIINLNLANESEYSSLSAKGQTKKIFTSCFSSENGLCSNTICLNSDSSFTFEFGCEGRSTISAGVWNTIGDSIELKTYLEDYKPKFYKLEFSSDSVVSKNLLIQILDKTGFPIRDFVIVPKRSNDKFIFTSNSDIVLDSMNNRVNIFKTDSNGLVVLSKALFDSLTFSQLKLLGEEKYSIINPKDSDSLTIKLTLNAIGFRYKELKYQTWKDSRKYFLTRTELLGHNSTYKKINESSH